jgi:hypothetical protein
MRLADLIDRLLEVQNEKGSDVEVKLSTWCGTNNAFVLFDLKNITGGDIDHYMNGHGHYCLSGEVSKETKEDTIKGIEAMEAQGYTYFRSQFVDKGLFPTPGLSPCDWHNLW